MDVTFRQTDCFGGQLCPRNRASRYLAPESASIVNDTRTLERN